MTDIYAVLSMGGQALLTHQRAIYVTGNNIANVNTPGYSRQRLRLESNTPVQTAMGLMGNGVRAAGVERIYERFLGIQINQESQNLGRWEAFKDGAEAVEVVFDETDGYGLSQALSEFWNAWHDVSNNPSGQTERIVLRAKAESLTDTFNGKYADLLREQQQLDMRIQDAVDQINRLSEEIADLNQKIVETESGGHPANDYRDRRDLLLKELSGYIDINTIEDAGGSVSVSVASGRSLVERTQTWQLDTQTNADGLAQIVWLDGAGGAVDMTDQITGGKLKGWLDVRDGVIQDYLYRLDNLAQTLTDEVNALHAAGFGLDGSTGNAFFSGAGAAGIEVNAAILDNVNLIAAASTAEGVPGDNRNAIAIAALQHELLIDGNTATLDAYYQSLVSDSGTQVQRADAHHSHQLDMVSHLENYRDSISGVSLDEEMVNLVKFQSAYEAAAKLISTADELMQTVLQML